ncbi:MAG: two-component regulator propeller domain-containing protein [Granulicella sp.]
MRLCYRRCKIIPYLLATMALCGAMAARALQPGGNLGQYSRQVWSTDNGLPQSSVHAILQTSDGFLWVGTEGGLARFDGYQFSVFDTESTPRLPGNDVQSLLEDQVGALWVGTETGLVRLKDGLAQIYTTASGLPSDEIRTVSQTKDGTLWVTTAAGIASASAVGEGRAIRFHAFTRSEGLLSNTVTAITKDAHGGVWVGTTLGLNHIVAGHVERGPKDTVGISIEALGSINGTGDNAYQLLIATPDKVMRFAGGELTPIAPQVSLPLGGVHSLVGTAEGVWIAGKSGVTLVRPSGAQLFVMGKDLPGSQVSTIFRDRRGAVWIGTNAGLARWSDGKMETISGSANSTTSAILSLYEDHEGNLWTGTETDGIGILRDPLFQILDRRQGLVDESVTSVAQAGDGSLWVGTSRVGLNRFDLDHSTNQVFTANNSLASDTILSIASNSIGSTRPPELWVGTPDGLNELVNGRWKLYTSADGLADDFVRSLLIAKGGNLWIGTRRGITEWKSGHGTTWTMADGLGSDLVGAMVQDTTGDLWVGTLGGLSQIHDGKIRNFTTVNGLPSNTVTALEAGPDGTLWVGTKDQGLALRDSNGFFSFAKAARLPRNIYAILLDGYGAIWLSSDLGIYRVAIQSLEAFRAGRVPDVAVMSYGTGDGLPSLEDSGIGHPSAVRLADGQLCFASRRGVVVFNPKNQVDTGFTPPVVLEQVTIDGRSVTAGEMASIPAGASNFSFSFAGISFAAPQRVQYRYILEGFDKQWIESGTRRTAFYTNLSPGRYRFRVSARISGGPWSEPGASISIRLQPRFYQTTLFRIVLALLAAVALFGLYRLRVKTLQDRFAAVGAERNRIAREIHDTLAQGFVAVSVRLEIMSQLLRTQSTDDCRKQLDQTRSLVRDSLAEARRSIWDLRAEGIGSMTLPSRLARSVQQVMSSGTEARFETTGTYRPLEHKLEEELFRIAQEAITNSLRHAAARIIEVRLTYTSELVLLEVTDDGRGFDATQPPATRQGHFGVIGMEERAHKIGATVIVESSFGRGTTVRIEKRLQARDVATSKEDTHA